MRVLFATSEVVPLIKTGGLADVSAALPAALRERGIDVRLLLPGYPQVLKALPHRQLVADLFPVHSFPAACLFASWLPNGVPLFVIECAELFERGGGAYQDENGIDWPDNALRFGMLSWVAAWMGSAGSTLDWKPDLVHCNDWQAGLAPAYLHFADDAAPCVMTVHNLAFQGNFPSYMVVELGLPIDCFQPDGVEFYGNLSFMKAGLYYADHITTVSPSYAREIQTDPLGFGLQGLLAYRREKVTGILNGIDVEGWNPATDPDLVQLYSLNDLSGKSANKCGLQKRMGLHVDSDLPLFALVSRFTQQKGVDLVLEIAPQLVNLPAQLVLLGNGDAGMQRAALDLLHHFPGKIGVYIGFDESLSHLIHGGADIFLMPSRFEPCGLSQMHSQRYGVPPVVYATGGLIDTVTDYNEVTCAQGLASGFVFHSMDVASLHATVKRAASVYHDKKSWRALQHNCMIRDFSWNRSAAAYHDVYMNLIRP